MKKSAAHTHTKKKDKGIIFIFILFIPIRGLKLYLFTRIIAEFQTVNSEKTQSQRNIPDKQEAIK